MQIERELTSDQLDKKFVGELTRFISTLNPINLTVRSTVRSNAEFDRAFQIAIGDINSRMINLMVSMVKELPNSQKDRLSNKIKAEQIDVALPTDIELGKVPFSIYSNKNDSYIKGKISWYYSPLEDMGSSLMYEIIYDEQSNTEQ